MLWIENIGCSPVYLVFIVFVVLIFLYRAEVLQSVQIYRATEKLNEWKRRKNNGIHTVNNQNARVDAVHTSHFAHLLLICYYYYGRFFSADQFICIWCCSLHTNKHQLWVIFLIPKCNLQNTNKSPK